LNNLNQVNLSGLASSNKKRLNQGNSHALLQNNLNSNYVRVVNIYSVNNGYKKRKSHANESRVQLNHSMLPQVGS